MYFTSEWHHLFLLFHLLFFSNSRQSRSDFMAIVLIALTSLDCLRILRMAINRMTMLNVYFLINAKAFSLQLVNENLQISF
jgi:hypothetical protein